MEDLTGKQLGSYQVVNRLGEGGMATVYQAYHPAMERYVALKILPRHFATDPTFVGRFEQEARVLAKLQHPHILPVFDYGQFDGYTFIVMPFLQNGDLNDLLQNHPLPLAQIRRIISQLGDALDYAHQRGLVHRDVKPSNVLLDERQNCLLSDFGITKVVESTAKFTATGGILGTPAYMSPEQGTGRPLDGRSDIYSLGVMLYEMATGRVPYRADTPLAVLFKHVQDPLPLPRQQNPDLPEAVEHVILKALAKQPEDRFATAGEMVKALRMAIPETMAVETSPVEAVNSDQAGPSPGLSHQVPMITKSETDLAGNPPGGIPRILIATAVIILLAGGSALGFWLGTKPVSEPPGVPAAMEPTASVTPILPTVSPTPTEPIRPSPTPLSAAADTLPSPTATPSPPTVTPSPTITVTPLLTEPPALTSTSAQPAGLVDDFTNPEIDTQQWGIIQGGGQIVARNGAVQLLSSDRTFPLIYARQNPFPPTGDFRVSIAFRYLNITDRGVGIRLGTTLATYGADQNLDRDQLFAGRLIEVWQDVNNWHISVGAENSEVYVLPTGDLSRHELEISYVDTSYQVNLDGSPVYSSNPAAERPTVLWFGNPAQVDEVGAWTGLEIDFVSVEPLEVVTPGCPAEPDYFGSVWESHPQLGCPLRALHSDFTFQRFERGTLLWQKSPEPATIYAFYTDNGRWERQTDPGGPPTTSCPEAEQTGGLGPILSFGTIWCEPWDWKTRLGQPLDQERDGKNSPIQQFENGTVLTAGEVGGFILFADSRWEKANE